MMYLIQYCYGFMEKVPSGYQFPLVKLAEMHEMNDLALVVLQQVELTVESFLPLAACLADEKKCKEVFGPFVEKLIQFGVKNASRVINQETIQHIPLHIHYRIWLALAQSKK